MVIARMIILFKYFMIVFPKYVCFTMKLKKGYFCIFPTCALLINTSYYLKSILFPNGHDFDYVFIS